MIAFHFLQFTMKEGKAMNTSPSPRRVLSGYRHSAVKRNTNRAADCESLAQLLEDFIPRFKNEHERQFYQEVVAAYRTAARDLLRRAWSDEQETFNEEEQCPL
jgi:hypothetical protein